MLCLRVDASLRPLGVAVARRQSPHARNAPDAPRPLGLTDLPELPRAPEASTSPATEEEEVVLPVVEERASVRKRRVKTGKVRVSKVVRQREEVVDVPLMREEAEIQRVAVNRFVEGPVEVRHEGETLVVPLLEEVLIVERRLMLREELHIRRQRTTEHRPQRVPLRTEQVTIERDGPAPDAHQDLDD